MTKILIAEDSYFMRNQLTGILNKAGFSDIVYAKNGQEAIEIYRKEKPDLVLLDVIMPKLNGIDVLKVLAPRAKIIMVTVVGSKSMIDEIKSIGATDYITKPFDSKILIRKVKDVLDKKK